MNDRLHLSLDKPLCRRVRSRVLSRFVPAIIYTRDVELNLRLRVAQWALILSATFMVTACTPPEIEPPKKPKTAAQAYIVNLPASVDLERDIPPLKYEDGTFRVDGLVRQSRKYLEQRISVKGYVTEVAQCKNKVGEICDKPYVWISHALGDEESRMRVVDMKRKQLRRFKVGKLYVFEGRFAQTSSSGYADSRGLLRLKKHRLVRVR